MSKLLQLLGQEKYDKLKAAMGDAFDAYEQQFENGEVTEDEVNAKLTELSITVEDAAGAEEVDGVAGGSTEPVVKTGEDATEPDITAVLADGWLTDGKVDLEKILYKPLKDFITGLQDIAMRADWEAKYKIAILSEAMKQGMYDMDDAMRFINTNDLSTDADGKIIGVKEAFAKLRSEKPHLFKPIKVGGKNPIDSGFDPVDSKVTSKPRSYAEAVEQTRALMN